MFPGLVLLGLLVCGASTWTKAHRHGCSEVTFSVAATSRNIAFSSPPDPNNGTAIVAFIVDVWRGNPPASSGTVAVTGTFDIRGTYCVPRKLKRSDALEILVHGITYNKTMWAGMGFGDHYNWHKYASTRGYATLALDRLGHGLSSKPDPLSVVQPQMHIEIIHKIIAAARTGSSPLSRAFGRRFNNVVFVGHSYGSYVGAALGSKYPADLDALVLTGFSTTFDFSDVIDAQWASAVTVNPKRFAGMPHGYIAMANQTERTTTFYVGSFDPAIPPVDYAFEDTVSSGEVGGLGAILRPATGYTNPLLVVTTVEDVFFCKPPLSRCEAILAQSQPDYFPNVLDYAYFAPENTGHDLTLHYTAPQTFDKVHDWLDQRL